jgi:asparagine synthase (glutamine-hydrolysing)
MANAPQQQSSHQSFTSPVNGPIFLVYYAPGVLMCGIIGDLSRSSTQLSMAEAIRLQRHRGPNAQLEVTLSHPPWSLHLAHQRLSIIDLTDAANQPFQDQDYSLIYNGEIYNYLEIREELEAEGVSFQTSSDTEVVFQCLKVRGIEASLKLFNGMWAFAFYDKKNQSITLSRDRFGIKPLYYFTNKDRLVFASELKALLKLTGQKHSLNPQVIGAYVEQHLLEADPKQTFFSDIYKLQPGHYATVHLQSNELKLDATPYYHLNAIQKNQFKSEEQAVHQLREHLDKAIQLRLRSDVPVGILLSGGLDSSTLSALSFDQLKAKTKLLSYVSDNPEVDESIFIDQVASHLDLKVEKIKFELQPQEFMSLLEEVTFQNDQPVHSFAAVAHYLLMKEAKKLDVTVILSGQGADETLCGYRKYAIFFIKHLLQQGRWLKALLTLLQALWHGEIIRGFSFKDAKRYLPQFLLGKTKSLLSDRLQKKFKASSLGLQANETLTERQIRDICFFSVPSLLHYEDRMSMAHSREIRVPFLDHELVEFLLSLPDSLKYRGGWTKYLLRKAMRTKLPQKIVWRKDKKGFTNPQRDWLRKDLRKDLERVYFSSEAPIYKLDLIDQKALLDCYQAFCEPQNTAISEREIFAPFALNLWLEIYGEHIDTEP